MAPVKNAGRGGGWRTKMSPRFFALGLLAAGGVLFALLALGSAQFGQDRLSVLTVQIDRTAMQLDRLEALRQELFTADVLANTSMPDSQAQLVAMLHSATRIRSLSTMIQATLSSEDPNGQTVSRLRDALEVEARLLERYRPIQRAVVAASGRAVNDAGLLEARALTNVHDQINRQARAANVTTGLALLLAFAAGGAAAGALLVRTSQAERAQRAEHSFSRQVMDSLGQGLALEDLQGRLEYANPALENLIGVGPGELVGRNAMDLVTPSSQTLLTELKDLLRAGASASHELLVRRADGELAPVLVSATPRQDGRGSIAVVTDQRERATREAALRCRTLEAEQARQAAESLAGIIKLMSDTHGDLRAQMGPAVELLRKAMPFDFAWLVATRGSARSNHDLTVAGAIWSHGQPARLVMAPLRDGRELVMRAIGDGELHFLDDYRQALDLRSGRFEAAGLRSAALMPLSEPAATLGLAVILGRAEPGPWSDLERRLLEAAARAAQVGIAHQSHEREIAWMARHDALTGLRNRRAFDDDLESRLNSDDTLVLTVLDLDGLKRVNDEEGHDRGDALLRAFGHALRRALRATDRIYRLGGDEFAVIAPGARYEQAGRFLERVEQAGAMLRDWGFASVGVSAGVSARPQDGQDQGQLVRLADQRMYAMKQEHHEASRPRQSASAAPS